MSLRSRLLIGVLVLVTAALVVAAVAIYTEQRSYLYGRLDQRVVAAAAPISYALGVDARLLKRPSTDWDQPAVRRAVRSSPARGLAEFLPSGTYGALVGRNGRVLRGPIKANPDEQQPGAPAFPSKFKVSRPGTSPKLFTIGARGRPDYRYRVAALGLQSGAGAILVAVPLRDVDQTLDRLIVVEALVVASVIVLLVGMGWLVIRVALRPLDQMGRVARAIADGDFSRRVTPDTSRTEVGRLGLSLNRMLVRIEDAFADRARSEERRRQFLADASHELRTPLASIRGYAELFRLGPAQDPEALARAMERIEAEATRMGILVEDLLMLANLDELPEARQVSVELTAVGEHAVSDARAMAPDRDISLLAGRAVEVLGDPDRLRQVFTNLMANAVLHTPAGTAIEVGIRREGGDAVIQVRDRGRGLPDGAEDKVFERFWRAENGRARGPGGSGLGLSIVREIVEAHHGSVRADNRAGGGAVFTVRLPAAPTLGPGEAGLAREPGADESAARESAARERGAREPGETREPEPGRESERQPARAGAGG